MGEQSILVVGSIAIDDVETPHGRREGPGGSATYFSASASRFAPVRFVGVVGEDFPQSVIDSLAGCGVDMAGLERVTGATFRWRGRYETDLSDAETLATHLNVFEGFQPKIPKNWRQTPIVMLGNIHPQLQLDVLDQMESPTLVAADTMNFWIGGERETLLKVLSRIDVLVINETEVRMLSGKSNIYLGAEAVLGMGPKVLVVKQGGYGALVVHPDGLFLVPAVPLRTVIDPTGAGDTFAAGMIGALAAEGSYGFSAFRRAAVRGSVMASFACEGFGLDRVLSVTPEEIEARDAELRALIHVD